MSRWSLRQESGLSVVEPETAAAPPSGAANGLLDLHAALEEMAHLSTVADDAARPAAPVRAPLPQTGDVTAAGSARLIRITGEIEALIEEEAPLSSALLPTDARAAFEILSPHCPGKWAEAFRKLRGRLVEERVKWEAAGRQLGSVAVVSPRRSGGRSATARNLAACLGARPDAKVLLVDADAGRPSLHKRLRIPVSPGLAEATGSAGDGEWLRYVWRVPDSGLYVLPLGKTAGTGIDALDCLRLPALLERARTCFTWVILDAPPMETADGEALSDVADGTVLVLRNGREYFDEANAAVRRLDPARLVGAILNYAG